VIGQAGACRNACWQCDACEHVTLYWNGDGGGATFLKIFVIVYCGDDHRT
jgi:hypothetical protein